MHPPSPAPIPADLAPPNRGFPQGRAQTSGHRWQRYAVKTFWREATKNFASKAVQRQQGEELLRVSDKVNILLLLAVPYLLLVILEGSILRVRS